MLLNLLMNLLFCFDSQFGNLSQSIFLTSNSRATTSLELIHNDVWGHVSILSREGFRYYVHFLEDYSRFIWIFPPRDKSECKTIFMQF